MYTFLVLGLIPGTNIQIGFWTWVILMVAMIVAFRVYKKRLSKTISDWWHKYDDVEDVDRRPLHASRLHDRLPRLAR